MLLFANQDDARPTAILGLAALGAFLVYRFQRWRALPYYFALDKWEKEERALYAVRQLEHRDRLLAINPYQFESAIARLYQSLGFTAKQTRLSGDGGWDVELTNSEGSRYLVECKQFRPERAVGRPILQKLHSALITERAHGAFCVTTGTFSKHAKEFGQTHGIELVDGIALGLLMLRAYSDQSDFKVEGLCRACGDIVPFDPDDLETVFQRCGNGHWIKHPFIAETHPVVSQRQRELKRSGQWTKG